MKKNRYLAEVIHIELRQTSKLIREYRKNTFNEYLSIITRIVEQGQEAGIFRKEIHPQIARQIIFGSLDEISRCWHVGSDCSFTTEEVSWQLTSLFQSGLLVSNR
jgi:TetR/AcrR family fatty acid metabolism transcriptional regulator